MICDDYIFFLSFFTAIAVLLLCHLMGRGDYNERREE